VLATKDAAGANLATIDGSTWDPWAQRLIFTTESANAPTYAATPDYPSTITRPLGLDRPRRLRGDPERLSRQSLDRGGHRRLQQGGGGVARQPNSYLYRFTPQHPGDLLHGKVEALQVLRGPNDPNRLDDESKYPSARPDGAPHVRQTSSRRSGCSCHDTANETAAFNANVLAKAGRRNAVQAARKRPLPSRFSLPRVLLRRDGDTNATSPENNHAGGWARS